MAGILRFYVDRGWISFIYESRFRIRWCSCRPVLRCGSRRMGSTNLLIFKYPFGLYSGGMLTVNKSVNCQAVVNGVSMTG